MDGGHVGLLRDSRVQSQRTASSLQASGEAARRLADDALAAAAGRIDVLVNNAAHILPAQSLLESTVSGVRGKEGTALYGASKAALHSLTKSWAAEPGPKGIRVNAIAPGPIATELNAAQMPMREQLTASSYPARRPGTAAEIADAVVFLASDQASYIHGVLLPVDGGALTR